MIGPEAPVDRDRSLSFSPKVSNQWQENHVARANPFDCGHNLARHQLRQWKGGNLRAACSRSGHGFSIAASIIRCKTRNTPSVASESTNRSRIIEAFIGEYASGKTEVSINRALHIRRPAERMMLLDLDTEEPVYTVRTVRPILEQRGLDVVSLDADRVFGLGEAGVPVTDEMINVLSRSGNVVIDVGYGVHGAAALNLLLGIEDEPELAVYCVVNSRRPMTSTPRLIASYIESLKPCHFIINNTNLGNETTRDVIMDGVEVVAEASKISGRPVAAVSIAIDVADRLQLTPQDVGAPLWRLELFMTGGPKL